MAAALAKFGVLAAPAFGVAARRSRLRHHCSLLVVRTGMTNDVGLMNSTSARSSGRRILSSAKESKNSPQAVTEKVASSTQGEAATSSPSTSNASSFRSYWNWFTGPKEMPERWTASWYREMALLCTVFAITGSSTMVLVSRFCAPPFWAFSESSPGSPPSLTVSWRMLFRYDQQFQRDLA
jgi:hypothetical protein